MMVSMLLIVLYNLADSVWVAGLGADALAAIGFITPLFMVLVGLGNGLGAGANSLIARYIGADNYKKSIKCRGRGNTEKKIYCITIRYVL